MPDFLDLGTEIEQAADIGATLHLLVARFSQAPLQYGKAIRDLCASDRDAFAAAAVSVLREETDARGCRYLVTVLWTNHLLIAMLGDITLPKEIVLKLAATAARVDPQLPLRLIQFLVAGMLEGKDIEESCSNRLLEVLGNISDGLSAQRFIRQMLRHPNPRIRSKVTLLLDHGGPGIRAIRSILADPEEDPRVRANALEALWSGNRPEFAPIFESCLGDADNRVAGNAVLGMYFSGDVRSIPALAHMAEHENASFRRTAVWVMGMTKDPRFLPLAGRFLGEPNKAARNTVFRAVQSIKTAVTARSKGAPLKVTVLGTQTEETGFQRVRVAVNSSVTGKPVSVPPTGFALYSGPEPIADFSCEEQTSDKISLAFVLPRRPNLGDHLRAEMILSLRDSLDSKARAEQWAIARFLEPADSRRTHAHFAGADAGNGIQTAANGGFRTDTGVPRVTFTASASDLRIAIEIPGARYEADPNAVEAALSVLNGFLPLRGSRHLLLVVDACDQVDEQLVGKLISTAESASASVHALCFEHNPQLQRVCEATAGLYRTLPDYSALRCEIAEVYSALKSHYLIEFWPQAAVGESEVLSVQVNTENEFGAAEVKPLRA